ncbi:MAG: hypothetical protein KF745_00015 [Phycisphaeraceae bacterium]|nr:hypothetical protein [Phycisphaeraceae bacterium]
MALRTTNSAPEPGGAFERDTMIAVHDVRSAFARIIEHKCPGSKAVTSLCEQFGIHRKLAWQVGKVSYTDDPFVAAKHIPSGKSLSAWLDAAESVGVPPSMVNAARQATDRFEALAAAHAGSRAELEMLLESCSSQYDAESHARWRQQSFEGNSFVWGAHCRVLLALMVLVPSEDKPRYFHAAQLRGLIGFRQTRPGVRWVVNQSVVADDSSRTENSIQRVPLDPTAASRHGGVPVMPQFCSQPMPELTRRRAADGMVMDEFLAGPVGQRGERTLVTGEMARNIGPAHATEHDRVAHFGTAVRVPAELLHYDLFVHSSLFGRVERELRVFSDLASPIAFDDSDSLPVAERIAPLGRGVALAQTPDIPAYTDLASAAFYALGANADDYDLFRVRMPYPPMPVTVMMRHPLPDLA